MIRGHQWDIVKVRIRPGDGAEHPAVVFSREEWCQDEHRRMLNVLYCTTARPNVAPDVCDVALDNGADGLDWRTLASCEHIHTVSKASVSSIVGRVGIERRRQIGRTMVRAFRIPL